MVKILTLLFITSYLTYLFSVEQICNIDSTEKGFCKNNNQENKASNSTSVIDDFNLLMDYLSTKKICSSTLKPNIFKSILFNKIFGSKKERTSVEEDRFGNGSETKKLLQNLNHNGVSDIETQLIDLCGIKTILIKKKDSPVKNKFAIILSGSHGTAEKYLPYLCSAYYKKGYTCIIFNYRGFGGKHDKVNLYSGPADFHPNPYSVVEDAMTVLKHIPFSCQEFKDDKIEIILHGYSLGGYALSSMINFLASNEMNGKYDNIKNSISKIIFDRPMTSLDDAIRGTFNGNKFLNDYTGRISTNLAGKMHSLEELPLAVKENKTEFTDKIKNNFYYIMDSKNFTNNNILYSNGLYDSQKRIRDNNKDIFKAVNTYRIDGFSHVNSYPSYNFLNTKILNENIESH